MVFFMAEYVKYDMNDAYVEIESRTDLYPYYGTNFGRLGKHLNGDYIKLAL